MPAFILGAIVGLAAVAVFVYRDQVSALVTDFVTRLKNLKK